MLCCANNSGVTATGSGTTAEEAVVITIASIVAWDGALAATSKRVGNEPSIPAACVPAPYKEQGRPIGSLPHRGRGLAALLLRGTESDAYAILGECNPNPAGMAELADAADSKSADPCGHGGSTPPPGTMALPQTHHIGQVSRFHAGSRAVFMRDTVLN